ncbi:MAG: pitrilysin family protein [Candidatus Marinimicrobia bacterium]|jgi:zinc protease|nr:hypothetical protein [Candidatus Neomarinimicrobiota bacterium]MDP6296968.1 pitrilysin family protein [Candidatus Neomarinimicrobiota bacterium]MDP7120764.1 pitrilysin family protein [Candidatus Neomarinimicrobiota bacterium]MDP7483322.1 pitrilysin family protein [Candidatus Neomarinimicrobiota bacterium]MDP7716671.1 pitrilysin family protein [Candidatus Neomarinimicrobiota bacterium]|tara:strand:- start:41 stop:1333 length:1293 start_codon:yes stop_codon:yes gene_type:complete
MLSKSSKLAPKVKSSSPLEGLTLNFLKTEVKDVITLRGSFLGGDVFAEENIVVPEITAAMLDLGTQKRDKFEISDALESVGAKLAFASGRYRVQFSGKCLRENLPLLIELLAEQLMIPAYNKKDLQSVVQRRTAEMRKAKEDTRTRAIETFLMELYPEGHPNRAMGLDRLIENTQKVTTKQLQSFHGVNYGLGTAHICFVGDVDHRIVEEEVAKRFCGWEKSPLTLETATKSQANIIGGSLSKVVHIPDKTSADVVTGHGIGIDREHDDYYAVMMSHFILGGNFSARLMATVRDKEGLTYGIQSSTGGVEEGNDGYWYIWGTFAPDIIDKAKKSIEKQLNLWLREGISGDELETKKRTISGMYQIGLDTTSGLANRILTTVERGKELSFMDEYPNLINSLTLEQVNSAIHSYCNLGKRITVVAGTLNGTN